MFELTMPPEGPEISDDLEAVRQRFRSHWTHPTTRASLSTVCEPVGFNDAIQLEV